MTITGSKTVFVEMISTAFLATTRDFLSASSAVVVTGLDWGWWLGCQYVNPQCSEAIWHDSGLRGRGDLLGLMTSYRVFAYHISLTV